MLTGIILAGGQNRRMKGFHKALLDFQGEVFIDRQIRIMNKLCAEIIIVTQHQELLSAYSSDNIRVISDELEGRGPLAGMHVALVQSIYNNTWIVGCDMPFISDKAAEMMLRLKEQLQCHVVIPFIEGKTHSLHGIYDKACAPMIAKLLSDGENRVRKLLETVDSVELDEKIFLEQQIDSRFVMNINTNEEYKQAIKIEEARQI